MIADKIEALLADKGYDAEAIREELANANVEAVIPAKSNLREPTEHDREKYRWCNLVDWRLDLCRAGTIWADARIRVRGVLVEADLVDVDEIAVDNVYPLIHD